MLKKIKKIFGRYRRSLAKWYGMKMVRDNIIAQSKKLDRHLKLSKEQVRETQEFWVSMIGREIPLYCHEYFYSRTGHFTKEYVPKDIYHYDILPRANEKSLHHTYCDKNLTDVFFDKADVAHAILKNMKGRYFYEDRPVSEQEAVELCSNMSNVIIKPSRLSKGHGVKLISVANGITNVDGKTIAELFKDYKQNFLIQECVKQHKDMAGPNPTSVNTIRILSYHSKDEVLIIYSVVRIGRKGSVIDNQSAGGISTAIDENGRLAATAFGGYVENDIGKTDSGIELAGYQLPSYDRVIDFVKRLHLRLPFFDIVGWDVAVREDGSPVLIEFNLNPGLSQSAFGSGMGEYTERIIRELWPKPNSWFPDK